MPTILDAEYSSEDDSDPDYEYGDDDDAVPKRLQRSAFASDAAFEAATKQRKSAKSKERYQLKKDAERARKRAAYAAMPATQKRQAAIKRYVKEHAGDAPLHRTNPAAARRYNIAVEPPGPVVVKVIRAANVIGAQHVQVDVEQQPQLAEDPAAPTSYAGMLAAFGRFFPADTQIKTRNLYIQNATLVLQLVTGKTKTEVAAMDDVAPVFRDADNTIARVEDMRMTRASKTKAKGALVSTNTIKTRLQAINVLVTHWAALKLNTVMKGKYSDVWQRYKDTSIEEDETRDRGTMVALADVVRWVLAAWGASSMQYVYIMLYTCCPVRDDVGALHLVNTDAQATDQRVNYLVLTDTTEGGAMTVKINVYKTRKYGTLTYRLTPAVADVVDAWLLKPAHANNVYLFCKPRSNGQQPFTRQVTQAEANAGKDDGSMSPWVSDMLRRSLPIADHDLLDGRSINLLRRSWASSSPLPAAQAARLMAHSLITHKKVYVLPLRAAPAAGAAGPSKISPWAQQTAREWLWHRGALRASPPGGALLLLPRPSPRASVGTLLRRAEGVRGAEDRQRGREGSGERDSGEEFRGMHWAHVKRT